MAGKAPERGISMSAGAHRQRQSQRARRTGAEYLDSLRDDREVYIYGERVEGRHHAPRLPQHRAHDRAPLRRAARRQAQGQAPAADRHRQWRHDARLLQGAEDHGRPRSPAATRSPNGPRSPMAGWAARRTTRPRSSRRSARIPTSTIPTRTTPSAGTSSARSACRSSTTRSSIRRSIATGRRTRSPTSAATSRRRPTPA